jgi:hypothetical protein
LIATGALMRPFPVTEDDDSNVIVSEQDICVEEIKDCALDNGSMKAETNSTLLMFENRHV